MLTIDIGITAYIDHPKETYPCLYKSMDDSIIISAIPLDNNDIASFFKALPLFLINIVIRII